MAKKKKRGYTMSDKALAQRRAAGLSACDHATGPVTEEGKEASSRNAWKHGEYSAIANAGVWERLGLFAKPCRRTCPRYPCSLVESGRTEAGGNCLDKEVYLEAFTSLMAGLESGDPRFTHGLMAEQMAGAFEVVSRMREFIVHNEPLIEKPVINRQGEVVVNPKTGEPYVTLVPHPLIATFFKTLNGLGVTLPEMLATPQSAKRAETDGDTADAFQQMMEGVARTGGGAVRQRTFDVDGAETVEE